ncbi:MAG: thiamine phosphate synthase [Candidatus Promineifilaceae bacterium]|nr:thiamine phosphate synthase [Candidatus Promineifilaceae bacterium]
MKQSPTIRGVYLITDREACLGRPLDEVVLAAVEGGVSLVQLREKEASTRAFVETAEQMKALLAPHTVPLIINDRVDVALAVQADGMHVGQDDMPYPLARKLAGPEAIIGLSVSNLEQIEQADAYDVNYLGVGSIFPSPTKPDAKGRWGLDGLAAVRRRSRHRLVAIGGIDESNAADVIRAGADCIAVVSAICSAPDPYQAAQTLNQIVEETLGARKEETK